MPGEHVAQDQHGTKSVVSRVAPQDIGRASGTFNTLRQLGGAFGVALTGAVFATAGGYATARAFSEGYVPAMSVSAALAFAATTAGIVLPRHRRLAPTTITGHAAPVQSKAG
ncbi:hypothetical protein [Micromonospora fulviviridis]|uniref:hypothetical protein n=1 Tax=Micromonospora fulviviridis TaxID=47860 RepID=UPI0037A6A38D